MYSGKREGIDEAKMTFSYLDKIRLRLLYEWQSKQSFPETFLEIAKENERILDEEKKYKEA